MVEYIYDCVRATSGNDITICAIITDEDGEVVTESCWLSLEDDNEELTQVYGAFDGEQWTFTIPADVTTYLSGRFWYTIGRNFESISFKAPIYLV